MRFFLGIHHPNWLAMTDVPLFVSRRRLIAYKKLPVAKGAWALDSGGFSELTQHGQWTVPPEQYVEDVRRFSRDIGNMAWAAIQDSMCEPWLLEHLAQYKSAGFDLGKEKVVGVGSVCRRQHTQEAEDLIRELAGMKLKLHGFGFKLRGLKRVQKFLTSADSMAWSFRARRSEPLPGHMHKNCANCLDYALMWQESLVSGLRVAT